MEIVTNININLILTILIVLYYYFYWFLTRSWFGCACDFVASKKSKDCIHSHLGKKRISPDLESMFEGEESLHVQSVSV